MKMENQTRKRSPRAPSIGLEQALERAIRVYDQERLHAAPVDAVAQALGFKNASNGSAAVSIASLRYFGLLERPKDGFLSASKSVETYKYAPEEEMKKQIVLEFLKTPPLYKELLEKYSIGLPSTATLKYDLIQRGFLPQAVDSVLAAFLQSVSYAKYFDLHSPSNVSEESRIPPLHEEPEPETEDFKFQQLQIKSEESPKAFLVPTGEVDQIPIRLSGGRKAWLNIPTPFFESDKARIKAQIDVLFADTESSS
jgi:hypothetical protein